MLSHEFTKREKILLLVCAVLLLAIFYYEFAYKQFNEQMARYNTTTLDDQLQLQTSKAAKLAEMKSAIEGASNQHPGKIAVYNNLSGEVRILGEIFSGRASQVNLTWEEPTGSSGSDIVRRNVSVGFHVNSYGNLRTILSKLDNCKYRCVISDLAADSGEGSFENPDKGINVALKMTFFETTKGAATTKGIVITKDDTTSTDTQG